MQDNKKQVIIKKKLQSDKIIIYFIWAIETNVIYK